MAKDPKAALPGPGATPPGRSFKARFATGGRLAPVEDWLTQNIEGKWSIQMDSVSDDMSKKNYSVIFAVEADRDNFKRRYILGQAAYDQAKAPAAKPGFFARMFGGSKPKSPGKSSGKNPDKTESNKSK